MWRDLRSGPGAGSLSVSGASVAMVPFSLCSEKSPLVDVSRCTTAAVFTTLNFSNGTAQRGVGTL